VKRTAGEVFRSRRPVFWIACIVMLAASVVFFASGTDAGVFLGAVAFAIVFAGVSLVFYPTKRPPREVTIRPASVADEIAKLADLRDQGVISEAEFDAAKARLLS
jgi:hypothetical protein